MTGTKETAGTNPQGVGRSTRIGEWQMTGERRARTHETSLDRDFKLSAGARDPGGIAFATVLRPVKILCAWCCGEGQPGYMGEREPLDNPEPTHGICAHHHTLVLESLRHRDGFVTSSKIGVPAL